MIQPASFTTLPSLAQTGSALLNQGNAGGGSGRAEIAGGGQFHHELSRAKDTLGAAQRGVDGRGARATQTTTRNNSGGGKTARNTNDASHANKQNHTDDQDVKAQPSDDSKSDGTPKAKSSDKSGDPSQDSTDATGGQGLATAAATNPDSQTEDTSTTTGPGAAAVSNATDALLPAATEADGSNPTAATKDATTVKSTADNATDFLNLVAQAGAEPASSARPDAQSPAAAQAPPTPQTAATEQDPNVARVARGLQNALQQNGGSVTLRLQPPDLGSVKIQMDIHDGMASVEFQTDRPAVSDLLGHQLASLRDALQTHGLVVDKMEVRTTTTPTPPGAGAGQQADSSPGDGRSRGEFFTRQQSSGSAPQQAALTPEGESFGEVMVNAVA